MNQSIPANLSPCRFLHLLPIVIALCSAFLPAPLRAAEQITVLDLDLGSCWVKESVSIETGFKTWKIASFNDKSSFYLMDDAILYPDLRLSTRLDQELKKHFPTFPTSQYSVSLHCGGGGHQLLISLTGSPTPLCVWAKAAKGQSNAAIDIQAVYPNPDPVEGQPCIGVKEGAILIGLAPGVTSAEVMNYLRQAEPFKSKVLSAKDYPGLGFIGLELAPEYSFKLKEFRELVLADPFLRSKSAYVEYDALAIIVGEDLELLKGTYAGF